MLPSVLCFLLSVSSAFALYETVFCVCENKYIKWKTERIFAATICDFKHGYIRRGNEFITATKHRKISVTKVENLVLARERVCGDEETKRRYLRSPSADSDSNMGVIQNNDDNNPIKEYDLSRSKSIEKKTGVYYGKVWTNAGDAGSYSRCLTSKALANCKRATTHAGAGNQRSTNGKQVGDLVGVRFYRALWTQALRKQKIRGKP